jgi:TolB protein
VWLGWALVATAATAPPIDLTKERDMMGFPPPVPVSISGFTSEADGILKNDLTFMGFKFVGASEAQFLIAGSNGDRVEARVTDRLSKQSVLAKAYTGGALRGQVHALADDIATTITQRPGIAQTKIAFRAQTAARVSEIYIADFDAYNPQPATQDGAWAVAPCWAGHNALAYCSYKPGHPTIYLHQLSTGARAIVAAHPGANTSPAVSPDGKRIAMILSKGGNPDLYVSDTAGRNLIQLTRTSEAESSPCWSPDSTRICFVSRSSGAAAIYTIPAGGGSPKRISTPGASTPTEPDWSPDGKWIAFTVLTRSSFDICIVAAEGGRVWSGLADGEDPSWAPNSRALIFCQGPDRAKRLCLLDVPTKHVKSLARIFESNSQPSWAN